MIISVSDKCIQADHYLMEEIMYRKIFTEANGTHPSQQEWTCPYCNRTGKGLSNASRHHFDNCKLKEKE